MGPFDTVEAKSMSQTFSFKACKVANDKISSEDPRKFVLHNRRFFDTSKTAENSSNWLKIPEDKLKGSVIKRQFRRCLTKQRSNPFSILPTIIII